MTLSRDQVEDRLLDILDGDTAPQQAEIEAMLAAAPGHRDLIRRTLEASPELHRLAERIFGPSATRVAGSVTGSDDPEQIGPYVIRQWLGAGGMGTVYLAERTSPLQQRVALKVIKRGMDSAQILARFAAERQVLAAMDHPAIARVLDAGSADDGRPYFAMEYVDGEPITTFCDRHRLSVRERLELFLQVCYGVQHAHGKGVVHRDLKPGNVLVTERDGERQVKIIDFGVAKALFGPIGRTGMLTVPGQIVGTPEYMSPEQADGRDVDAGTDVYALGALLYELLVGARPFDREALLEAGWNRIAEVLRNTPAPRPSTRLNDRAFARVVVSRRNTEFRALLRELRSDLDWVVMRAIEPDRERRYLSPSELAADVLRYLQGEVVSAGPPSAWYRVRKLLRRHRAAAIATASGVACLALGLAAALYGLREARVYQGELLSRDAQQTLAIAARAEAQQAETDRDDALRRAAAATTERDAAEIALAEARERAATLERAGASVWLTGWLDRHATTLRAELTQAAASAPTSPDHAQRLCAAMTAARWLLTRDGDTWLALRGVDPTHEGHLRSLLDGLVTDVNAQIGAAARAERAIAAHVAHAEDWTSARQRLRRSARYGHLDLPVQFGLIPLGADRDGRECFWHVGSGDRPMRDDGSTFSARSGDGAILALMPGGMASLGAQRPGPGRDRNLDPDALPEEGPPHEGALAPYLVGLDVLTLAQWQRLADGSAIDAGCAPATGMTWAQASATLARGGLVLPTEARWEAACRAGLFAAAGSVAQWCLDRFAVYGVDPVTAGTGERRASNPRSTGRAVRGGCPSLPPELGRAAARNRRAAEESAVWLGVRAAREVLR